MLEPSALPPAALAERVAGLREKDPEPWLAVGEGALAFREDLEGAGVTVPADGSPLHRVSALALCRLARGAEPSGRDAVLPDYLRLPDAEIAYRQRRD
jgi:tRNA threonylcarbamoyladenosine biosynthesis protein TsaB